MDTAPADAAARPPAFARKRRWPRFLLVAATLLTGSLTVLHEELPELDGRHPSRVLVDTADTRLGRAIAPLARAHPGTSGFVPLADGQNAFAARFLLADAAERTLDIQYYLWHQDLSGTLLFEAVHRAADRGVRVRLLLDDNNTTGLDERLSALDAHPDIEVRLFNPFADRRWRWFGYLTEFARLNRRMHNKSFTADNQATIVGGRNIGDEYFDAGNDVLFVDLDVLAVGSVVHDVSLDFDRYWASASAYPAGIILPAVDVGQLAGLTSAADLVARDPAAHTYMRAITDSAFIRDLLTSRLAFEWAPIRMISDDPAKALGDLPPEDLLTHRLRQALGRPVRELQLVSPYFVPGDTGVDYFAALAGQGVAVSILTNSLQATDVAAVHAGYAKRRQPLLDAGVALFEMKGATAPERLRDRGLTGSSGSSLHAKVFSVDRARTFIGSFNFDPRSVRLNTEMGLVIDSPALASRVSDAFAHWIPVDAYRVRRDANGQLQWVEIRDGEQRVYAAEPGTSAWDRAAVALMSLMPIEWLL